MAKMTLLNMVQNILSSMDSDEVNSINDTIESQQVAEIVKETYYDLFSDLYVPEHQQFVKLEGLGDLTKPTVLRIPDNLVELNWLKYKDTETERYNKVVYCSPEVFITSLLNNISTTDNVSTVTLDNGLEFYVKNNKTPRFYTIYNDEYLLLDSYDTRFDSTVQASKTLAWGQQEPSWTASDTFVPSLDIQHFPLLLSEAKSVCFVTLKQIANQKEEQRARKHRISFQHRKWKSQENREAQFSNTRTDYARRR